MKHHLQGAELNGSHLRVVFMLMVFVLVVLLVLEIKKAVYFPGGGGKPELDRWDWLSNPATIARMLPPGSI